MVGSKRFAMAKRITILAGHYGSGKTNIAVNLAFQMNREGKKVAVCDLDIVNPYFRTKDSEEEFKKSGIRLISSEYANTNVDIPALPPEMYAVVDDKNTNFILDIGGDDRGALALGRLSDSIKNEGSYEMLLVANFFRPLTSDPSEMLSVMKEIELASGIPFTGIVNNSNLGEETEKEHILSSMEKAEAFSKLSGLPLVMTTVKESLYEEMKKTISNLFPLRLQKKYY